jgi:hypothetical protein
MPGVTEEQGYDPLSEDFNLGLYAKPILNIPVSSLLQQEFANVRKGKERST